MNAKAKKKKVRIILATAGAFALLLLLVKFLRPLPVTVAEVVRGKAIDAVYATGTVECDRRVEVKARVSGNIVRLLRAEGERVRAGEILARIDSSGAAHDLRSARVDLDEARRDLSRIEQLAREGVASSADAEEARARVERLAAALDSRATRVSDAEVVSPLDGVILARHVEEGQYVSVNEPLFKVGDDAGLMVEVWVDEAEVARVRDGREPRAVAEVSPAGQVSDAAPPRASDMPLPAGGSNQSRGGSAAAVSLYAFPGQAFLGRVYEILPDANRDRKAYLTKIRLDAPPEGLRSGMTAEVNVIVAEEEGALLVPTEAVEDSRVWAVRKGRARRVEIEAGVHDLLHTEVRAGLSEGERVVVSGFDRLSEGARVSGTLIVPKRKAPAESRSGSPF